MAYSTCSILLALTLSYLCGSISSAILTCKILGYPDPRQQGSGNPGATNVLRFGGKKAAIMTLMGDVLKGVIVVFCAQRLGFNPPLLSLVTGAVFLGHLYPVFFEFQGGKGVATAAGCLLALYWPLGFALIITWLSAALLTRYSSLAAVISAICAPLYAWYFTRTDYLAMTCVMSLLLLYRHRRNIKNLYYGQESKIGRKHKP